MTVTETQVTWITLKEAAEKYQVHTKTLRRWIASGLISANRFGPRLIRVDQSSIERMSRPLQHID